MCTVLLTMDSKLTLCLCSTVLFTHFLAVGIFLLAIALQRRSDQARVDNTSMNDLQLQESSQLSRMYATRQLGKLLLTLIAVWGFVTLAIGIVMLMIMTHVLPHLSLGVIYVLEASAKRTAMLIVHLCSCSPIHVRSAAPLYTHSLSSGSLRQCKLHYCTCVHAQW